MNKYTAIRVNLPSGTSYDIVVPNSQQGVGDGQVDAIKKLLFNNARTLITFTDVRLALFGEVAYLRTETDEAKLAEAYDHLGRAEAHVLNMLQVVSVTFNTFEMAI